MKETITDHINCLCGCEAKDQGYHFHKGRIVKFKGTVKEYEQRRK